MAYCRECGSPLRQGARFCGECGTLIDASPQREEDVRGAGSTDARRPRDTVADLSGRVTDALVRFMDAPDEPGSFIACTWSEGPDAAVAGEALAAVARAGRTAVAAGVARQIVREDANGPSGEAAAAADAGAKPMGAGGPTCPLCGAQVSAGARFCRACGKEIVRSAGPAAGGRPRCPHCGQEVSSGARFCRSCGREIVGTREMPVTVPAQRVCPHCGGAVGEGARFCRTCGRALG